MDNEQNISTDVDNSSDQEITKQEILDALEEPTDEQGNDEPTDETDDTSSDEQPDSQDNVQNKPSQEEDKKNECPEKFRNEDGSANVEKILKSYKELEPLINQKAQWEKERAELLPYKEQYDKQQQQNIESAKRMGFDSVQDMEFNYELASLTANEYAKYLRYTEDPERVRQMLEDYASNPTDELLSEIEFEFPSEAIKRVTIAQERQKLYYEDLLSKQAETQKMSNIESVINYAVQKHNDIFDYKPFKDLFVNVLTRYGENFTNEDAEMLIGTMVQMKDLFNKEFSKQSNKTEQNNQATDAISAINTSNSAPKTSEQEPDTSKMSYKELVKYLKTIV